MKEYSLTIPTGTRYTADNGKLGIARRDIIQKLTKSQLQKLIEYRFAGKDILNETGEDSFFELELEKPTDTIKKIKVSIFSIILSSGDENIQDDSNPEDDKNTDDEEKNPEKKVAGNMIFIKKGRVVEINGIKATFPEDFPIEGPKALVDQLLVKKGNPLAHINTPEFELYLDGEDYKVNANSIAFEN